MPDVWCLMCDDICLMSDMWWHQLSDVCWQTSDDMSDGRRLITDVSCQMSDVLSYDRRLISDVWWQMPVRHLRDSWCQMFDIWWQMPDVWYLLLDVWSQMSRARRLISYVWWQMSTIRRLMTDACQTSVVHTSTMEDTDHKDVWQCGTFPWSQSLLVGFGIGALLAYNFVQRDRLLRTRLNQKEMAVTFLQLAGKIWLQEAILLLI